MSLSITALDERTTPDAWTYAPAVPRPPANAKDADPLCCENAVPFPRPVTLPEIEEDAAKPPRALDEQELARELTAHHALLRRVAERILRCPEQAEDAVQDAIVALWNRTERPPELRGWLVKTVIHRSLHRRRTEMRRQRWEDEAAVAASITCPLCDPEDEFAQREWMEVVDAAVAGLSTEFQSVVVLRAQGREYDEIAQHLELPIGTVRSRLNRARRSLREQLSHEGP